MLIAIAYGALRPILMNMKRDHGLWSHGYNFKQSGNNFIILLAHLSK